MNLRALQIPKVATDMIRVYEEYYHSFYLEMVRMSNASFREYIREYLDLLESLAKEPGTPNVIRAAIGVVCMDKFGYHDFADLAKILDRLVPQQDAEYAKFTSWCIGKVIHHPDLEKSRFVSHLFLRFLDWTRSSGRRARPAAAATLLESLSMNAGSNVVSFFGELQSGIWSLVSHSSLQVQKATSRAMDMYTRAIIRYGRSDLHEYMEFFIALCRKLLYFGDPMRLYASLSLFEVLINRCPGYFVSNFADHYKKIAEATRDEPMLVAGQAYVVLSCLSQADPKQFIEYFAEEHFSRTSTVLLEFPFEITRALIMMCNTIPQFMRHKIEDLNRFAEQLLDEEPDCACRLVSTTLKAFDKAAMPSFDVITKMLDVGKLSEAFNEFVVAVADVGKGENEEINRMICVGIHRQLDGERKILALKLLARLPLNAIAEHGTLYEAVTQLFNCESVPVRCEVPRALYRVGQSSKDISDVSIYEKLLQMGIFEQSSRVRAAVIQTLCDNNSEVLASPGFMKFWKIFVNDDSTTVRVIVYQLLANIVDFNPLSLSGIVRRALLDTFFILRHVPSIRQRNRAMRCLPDLIRASASIIRGYSGGLMDTVMDILTTYNPKMKFENFLEEDALTSIMIGVMQSLILLTPLDPDEVSKHGLQIIDIVCNIALTTEHRLLSLWIFELLFQLLSVLGSNVEYRIKVPKILSTCSTFLSSTHSRKARMAILKVLGAIGCLEVSYQTDAQGTQAPQNMDDELARQFFNPSRDADGNIDESSLLSKTGAEQYLFAFTANSLLEVFKNNDLKDLYEDTIDALVQVLKFPRMYMLGYFDAFMGRLLDVMEGMSNDQLTAILPYFTELVANSTHNTSPFLKRSLQLITDRYSMEMSIPFLDLIIAFVSSIRDGFTPYAADTICLLVSILDDMKTVNDKISQRVLHAFSLLAGYASDMLYLIVPQVCDAVVCEQTLPKVRINSLNTLITITESVDLYPYLGPMVRALHFAVKSKDAKTANVGYELLTSILKTQGTAFLANAGPLLDSLRRANLERPELSQLVSEVQQGKYGDGFRFVSKGEKAPPPKKEVETHSFSEEAIVGRVKSSNLGPRLEQWMRSFVLALIANSPSAPIRATINLATTYYPLAQTLFKAAFFSCWRVMSDNGKHQICQFFQGVLNSEENFETVARDLLSLLVFMDRIEQPLEIPKPDVVRAAVRYGSVAFALRLLDRPSDHQSSDPMAYKDDDISVMIDLLVQLGDWQSAIGVWHRSRLRHWQSSENTEIMAKLQLWDLVEPIYAKNFNDNNDFESFRGLTETYAALGKWKQIIEYKGYFKRLTTEMKRDVASYFAEANLHEGLWSDLTDCLCYTPDDSARAGVLLALRDIHSGQYEKTEKTIEKVFSLLASRPIKFWTDHQQIHVDTVLACQELVEIHEIQQWSLGKNRKAIEDLWAKRMITAPREFSLWYQIITSRLKITGVTDDYLLNFFQLKSPTLGTKLHESAFSALFPNFEFATAPGIDQLCYIVTQWNMGNQQVALDGARALTETLTGDLLLKSQLLYSTWLLEIDNSSESLKDAYRHLKDIGLSLTVQETTVDSVREAYKQLKSEQGELTLTSQVYKDMLIDTSHLDLLRKWSDVNIALAQFDPQERSVYVIQGIVSLSKCISLWPSFPDVVRLLSLFFENASAPAIFEQTNGCVSSIDSKLLLQAAPQIFIQLSQNEEPVKSFIQGLVFDMLKKHYHEMVWSLLVLKFSMNKLRSQAAREILSKFRAINPEVSKEVVLIRKTLLQAAVTWNEKVLQRLTDAFDHYQRNNIDQVVMTLRTIVNMVKHPMCEMQQQFATQYSKNLSTLEKIIHEYRPGNQASKHQLSQWCKTMQEQLTEEIKNIHTIQLSAVSPELCNKDSFILAVPGTYDPDRPVIHIKYFVGQFSVYMSKQQPKDVIIKGEDGNFYQYLLKGHEDLRLDERIMQFFRLINSILTTETELNASLIQTVCVIPLSMSHGLVQWATGTDTLRAVVEQYRQLHSRNPLLEYDLLAQYGAPNFDFHEPIQKMQIISKICAEVPDTDIADFFWMKAGSAEKWWKQTTVFSTSTAMMSIVGYIIGLGDRHPGNLLINRFSGKVVHIDFGDCFERASLRKFLPEVVPFRLTRMMVRALGPGGVNGLFKSTFVNMSRILRKNRQVLEMVLSIFVHEPLIDPDITEDQSLLEIDDTECERPQSKTRVLSKAVTGSVIDNGRVYMEDHDQSGLSPVEMKNRIAQKLTGADQNDTVQSSVEEQATWLINLATDPYQLARMYSGWCPFW